MDLFLIKGAFDDLNPQTVESLNVISYRFCCSLRFINGNGAIIETKREKKGESFHG
jgi:hypothetical protein